MTMQWFLKPGVDPEALGFLPTMLNDEDPRPAREQFDSQYSHGGGWRPQRGHTMTANGGLKYPGDPVLPWLAKTRLRREVIRVYPYGYVAIVQPDGSFEACRMD